MDTIDSRGENNLRVAAPTMPVEVSVHDVHHRVCTARTRHGVHGPAHLRRNGRRRRHLPVSHYRAGDRSGAGPLNAVPSDAVGQRHLVLTVLTSAAVACLLYVWAIRVLEPDFSNRLVLLGGFLIAAAAALVLNAVCLDAANRTGRNSRP